MAQRKIATTIANQIDYSKDVRAAFEVHGKRIAEKAEAILFKKRKRKKLDLVALVAEVQELVQEAESELDGAAAAHADELADDDPLRQDRDVARREVVDAYLSAQSMITGAFGAAFARRVGLNVAIENRADLVRKMGSGAVRLLRKAKKPVSSFAGTKIDLGQLADALDGKVDRLAGLLDSLKREEREAQQTMVARDQAADYWANVVTFAGSLLEGLARIAGEYDIADRVRPTERRRAGIESQAATDASDTDASDTDASDTDASDTDASDTDATDTDATDTTS